MARWVGTKNVVFCSGYKVYKNVVSVREAWHSPKTLHIMFHDQAVRFIT